jgi:transcriptional regulator with XRE-family HTH domain
MSMKSIKETFRAALIFCLKKAKRGEKTALAKVSGVPISIILNAEAGRRGVSEDNRRKLAGALGYGYDEFLEMGQRILNNQEVIAPKVLALTPKPKYKKTLLPAEAAQLIEQILFIAEHDVDQLAYIAPISRMIYDRLSVKSDFDIKEAD